jgi:hypothetical protein
MNGRPFSPDEIALIEQRYREGVQYRVIGREFDRPKGTLAGVIARAIAAKRVMPRNDYFMRELLDA